MLIQTDGPFTTLSGPRRLKKRSFNFLASQACVSCRAGSHRPGHGPFIP